MHQGEKAFSVYGFAKNEKENISIFEEKEFKNMAVYVLALSDIHLKKLIKKGAFKEIMNEESTISN